MNSPSKKHLAASSRLRAKKRKIAPADGASGGVRVGSQGGVGCALYLVLC